MITRIKIQNMPIADEEKKAYNDFAVELARELGSVLIPPDTIVVHPAGTGHAE